MADIFDDVSDVNTDIGEKEVAQVQRAYELNRDRYLNLKYGEGDSDEKTQAKAKWDSRRKDLYAIARETNNRAISNFKSYRKATIELSREIAALEELEAVKGNLKEKFKERFATDFINSAKERALKDPKGVPYNDAATQEALKTAMEPGGAMEKEFEALYNTTRERSLKDELIRDSLSSTPSDPKSSTPPELREAQLVNKDLKELTGTVERNTARGRVTGESLDEQAKFEAKFEEHWGLKHGIIGKIPDTLRSKMQDDRKTFFEAETSPDERDKPALRVKAYKRLAADLTNGRAPEGTKPEIASISTLEAQKKAFEKAQATLDDKLKALYEETVNGAYWKEWVDNNDFAKDKKKPTFEEFKNGYLLELARDPETKKFDAKYDLMSFEDKQKRLAIVEKTVESATVVAVANNTKAQKEADAVAAKKDAEDKAANDALIQRTDNNTRLSQVAAVTKQELHEGNKMWSLRRFDADGNPDPNDKTVGYIGQSWTSDEDKKSNISYKEYVEIRAKFNAQIMKRTDLSKKENESLMLTADDFSTVTFEVEKADGTKEWRTANTLNFKDPKTAEKLATLQAKGVLKDGVAVTDDPKTKVASKPVENPKGDMFATITEVKTGTHVNPLPTDVNLPPAELGKYS